LIKPIRLSGHARERMLARGTNMEEVAETIRTAPWEPAEAGRFQCRKEFAYGRQWNEKVYATKQVRPILADKTDEILVVTIYVYYF
jgi:hypothetical protein